MTKTSSKILQRWLLLWSKKFSPPLERHSWPPPMFSLSFLTPSLFSVGVCSVSLCDLSTWKKWFYPMYMRRHNMVHRKYSFDFFFCTKWDLRVLNSLAKSMNRELSLVVRAQFWRGRGSTKELSVHVGKTFVVLISHWQKGISFPGLLRSIRYPDGVR